LLVKSYQELGLVTTTQDLPQGNKVANTQLFNQFWVVFDEIQYSLARLGERKLRSAPESGFLINFDLPSNHFQLFKPPSWERFRQKNFQRKLLYIKGVEEAKSV